MQTISISDINISNPYLRTKTDIDSLKKSIQTIGLINPLTINDKNELLAGGRRYQALKELGIKEVAVNKVSVNALEQELISIDENLVRKPLKKLELEECLNRGREIYEELNPTAKKIDIDAKDLTASEKKQEKADEENDMTSFAAITSEKTGLSKSVIKNAIRRDAHSSKNIKQARGNGDLSASQVNEIIKLSKEEQDLILPYVKEKSVKEVRKIIGQAKQRGVDSAIKLTSDTKELPKEFTHLETMAKKCNKLLSKLILENLDVDEEELNKVIDQVSSLKQQSEEFLDLYSDNQGFAHKTNENFEEVNALQ